MSLYQSMRALFLGCHCDDLELGCGGTLHKHARNWDITCVTLSIEGIYNGNPIFVAEASKKALASLGIIDVRHKAFMPNEFYKHRQKLWETLHKLDMEIQPDVVYVTEADNQQDHDTLYKETLRNFRRSSVILYKASVRNSPDHNYNFHEVLSADDVAAKKRSLDFYPKEYHDYIYFKKENVEAILRYSGIYIEEEFAEPFNAIKQIQR